MELAIDLEAFDLKKLKIKQQIALIIGMVSVFSILLISLLADYFINREFEKYIISQNMKTLEEITSQIKASYNENTKTWDTTYLHITGMNALDKGFILKIKDLDNKVIWSARECDENLCSDIMDEIIHKMKENNQSEDGKIIIKNINLTSVNGSIGSLSAEYYGPYFLLEGDYVLLDALNKILILTGILAIILSLLAGYFIARKITKPINKTIDITNEIAKGNFSKEIEDISSSKETFELIEAIKKLSKTLENEDNIRRQMTADISHELRTPLTSVATHLEAMLLGIWEIEPKRINSCHEEILRINNIVKDLENLAKADASGFDTKIEKIDLKKTTTEAIIGFEAELLQKNIKVEYNLKEINVLADPKRLKQAIINIFSNAIKYNVENGKISIGLSSEKNYGVIIIKDTGIGIAEEEKELVFERFYRGEKSRNRSTGGAGLGLSIAKSLIKAQNGYIELTSEKGIGTEFKIFLPME